MVRGDMAVKQGHNVKHTVYRIPYTIYGTLYTTYNLPTDKRTFSVLLPLAAGCNIVTYRFH